jgi:hypothetical protein
MRAAAFGSIKGAINHSVVSGIGVLRVLPGSARRWNEVARQNLVVTNSRSFKDHPMLAFEIIGGIFALLFLAAAMTGIEGDHGH